jgi:hypothetical protein
MLEGSRFSGFSLFNYNVPHSAKDYKGKNPVMVWRGLSVALKPGLCYYV